MTIQQRGPESVRNAGYPTRRAVRDGEEPSSRMRRLSHRSAVFLAVCAALVACGAPSGGQKDEESAASAVTLNQQAAALLPPAIRESGVLRVGKSEQPVPPMSMLNDDGKTWRGVDIDLINAIAKGLGLKVEYVFSNWDGLIPGLNSGRYDLVMDGVGDLMSRQKVADFVDYAQSGMTVMSRKDNAGQIKDKLDLCGKTVGVQTGVLAATTLKLLSDEQCTPAGKPAVTIQPFPSDNDGLVALRSGRLDAQVMDQVVALYQSSTEAGKASYAIAVEELNRKVPYGIVVAKSNTALSNALKEELAALLKDGTYDKILEQYGVKDIAIDQPAINGSTMP